MLTACASLPFGRGHSKDAKPVAGAVDSAIKKRCRDPGVDPDQQVAIAESRGWATCETNRADAAVRTIEDLQAAVTARVKRH